MACSWPGQVSALFLTVGIGPVSEDDPCNMGQGFVWVTRAALQGFLQLPSVPPCAVPDAAFPSPPPKNLHFP